MTEPGLLIVFRWYAWLRLSFISATSLASLWRGGILGEREVIFDRAQTFEMLELLFLSMLLLVLYLYSNRLRIRLGRFYLPLALAFATFSVLIEQSRLTPNIGFWQPDAYLFILLIIVAWQYDFRAVALYSVLIAGSDFLFNILFPPTAGVVGGVFISTQASGSVPNQVINIQGRLPDTFEAFVIYGRVLSRTLSFVIVGWVITRLVHSQREQRQELATANRQLLQHSATLEQLATSRERNRLSRELHDTLAHTLSGLSVQLDALLTTWKDMPAKAGKMVDDMLGVTRRGLDETRRTVKDLRATPLEELGLAVAVKALAEDICRRNDLTLELKIPEKIPELAPDVEQAFYRVSQEGLENVSRHANAKNVNLLLESSKESLNLEIRDDGEGFDPVGVDSKERYGLQLMRERAQLIGASFEITSRKGQGTTIRMEYAP
jgi:signal transduction histidine kinase